MKIPFTKYQGAGNDFVMIDQRSYAYVSHDNQELIARICDRKFGIGADGLILLETKEDYSFEMIYFNADGKTSSMCGNGGRCITAFAKELNIIDEDSKFLAIDGEHLSSIDENGQVSLQMNDVTNITQDEDAYILDTGSPHYVIFVEDLNDINVKKLGSAIRYSAEFRKEGINVNFVEITSEGLSVATYERGVEDETLSCGTGVTAAALAYAFRQQSQSELVKVQTKGGKLQVRFEKKSSGEFNNIWLEGPAKKVFGGEFIC